MTCNTCGDIFPLNSNPLQKTTRLYPTGQSLGLWPVKLLHNIMKIHIKVLMELFQLSTFCFASLFFEDTVKTLKHQRHKFCIGELLSCFKFWNIRFERMRREVRKCGVPKYQFKNTTMKQL